MTQVDAHQVQDNYKPVKSADRTLQILETLAASQSPMSLGELSRSLRIPKSSLHAILRNLTQRHWVDIDDSGQRFCLGLRALLVGASYVESDHVVSQVQPILDWLSAETGEVVHLGRLEGAEIVYLAKRESTHQVRLFSAVGRRLPAHATALGKSLLAARSDREVVRLLPWPLQRLTSNTIIDRDPLLQELADIRRMGFASDREENSEGVSCLAVALDTVSPPRDAISFSIPVFRMTSEMEVRALALLEEAKRRMDSLYRIGTSPVYSEGSKTRE